MKRFSCLLLAVLLLLPLHVQAERFSEGFFYYTVSDQSVTITGYFGREQVVTVPARIAGNPVNAIASGAFADSGITALYLPETITSIEGGAIDAGVTVVYNSNASVPAPTESAPTQAPTEAPTQPVQPVPDSSGTGALEEIEVEDDEESAPTVSDWELILGFLAKIVEALERIVR